MVTGAGVQTTAKDERLLVFVLLEKAAPICEELTQAGLHILSCQNTYTLREALHEGAGAVLLAEASGTETLESLAAVLSAQPDGSEVPLLYLTEAGSAHSAKRINRLLRRDVVVLESPLTHATLLSAVRLALTKRRQQYRVCDLLAALKIATGDRDTHAQKQAAELHYSEVRFSKVFDASPVPVTITTLSEGRYLEVNESALKLLGFGRGRSSGAQPQNSAAGSKALKRETNF